MQLGWIDYSKDERNKIISILNLLSSHEALDELGIGSVRDSLSDLLFPGISVLQTRAKYFLLIPYMFNDACIRSQSGKLHSGSEVRSYIDKCEDDIVYTLINNSYDTKGIIGKRNYSLNKTVQAKPSAIYWNGLRTFGILAEPSFSIVNACNAIYRKGRLHSKTERKNETEESGADDSDIMHDGYVIFNSISPRYSYIKEATIELKDYEAEFLKNRILHSEGSKESALAYLLKHPELMDKYNSFEDFQYQDFYGDLADRVRMAREFADFIYGAHLLYNIIFADGCDYKSEIIDSIKEEFDEYLYSYHSPCLEECRYRLKRDSRPLFMGNWTATHRRVKPLKKGN